jgi:hypothetical protein
MAQSCECPKCGSDISESYEPDDWSVGITAGWFCDACDLAVGDDGYREPMEGDVPLMTAKEFRGDKPLGTPISELRGRPEFPGDPRYEAWKCLCRSHGYD